MTKKAHWRRAFERSPVMGDLVESFWLYGKDGAKYRAYIHQERISASSLDGPGSILGPKTARLANGPALNFVDDNTFENAATGELLTRSTALPSKKKALARPDVGKKMRE